MSSTINPGTGEKRPPSDARRGGDVPAADKPSRPPRRAVRRRVSPPAAPAPALPRPDASAPEPARGTSLRRQMPAWAISVLVHVIAVLVLALFVTEPPRKPPVVAIVASTAEPDEAFEDLAIEIPEETPVETTDPVADVDMTTDVVVENVQTVSDASDVEAAPLAVDLADFGAATAPTADLLATIGAAGGVGASGLGGRKNARKMAMAGGGGADTEEAVDRALKWLAAHQLPDGSWTTDFNDCPSCQGQCRNSGHSKCDAGGVTALGLLPFLGRGYTHVEGPYRKEVQAGLKYLADRVATNAGGAYRSPDKGGYSQGLATIALCEAYGMTGDPALEKPAQMALDFVQAAQDPAYGGWSYAPRGPGYMSVTGFNVMALKSGQMAGLTLSSEALSKVSGYLDMMEYTHSGRVQYRYSAAQVSGAWGGHPESPDSIGAKSVSNVATLCRMYLGWKRDHPIIRQNVERIMETGPNVGTPYFNYYATQVVHHFGGEAWQAWNARMKEILLKTQATQGHEAGSWYFVHTRASDEEIGTAHAGRLYCTALATMMLEVYYRHMPIYGGKVVEDTFRE